MIEDTSKAAFVMSQSACAMIEAMGMAALNTYRDRRGETIAYDEEAFFKLIEKYGIGYNDVVGFLP